jgi:hypothetical protein
MNIRRGLLRLRGPAWFPRLGTKALVIGAIGVALATMPARAASFGSIVDKHGKTWISIRGDIELYDYRRFEYFIDTTLLPAARIIGLTLDSAGGNVTEAGIFAQVIRDKPGLQTYVADHRQCSSAR